MAWSKTRNRKDFGSHRKWHGCRGDVLKAAKRIVQISILVCAALSVGACKSLMGETVAADDASGSSGISGGQRNAPPTLAGTPVNSVKAGEEFRFQPQASDADGDKITFSITNKPNWADFDKSNGKLSGMPMLGNEGVYRGIRITASDGTDKSSLQFDVTVTAIGSASVTLAWTPPTQNDDGSTLNNLAGYKIYYGTEPGDYTNQVRVDNPGLSSFVVGNLTPTTYFFAATAFNTSGIESDFTNEIAVLAN